MFFKNDDRYDGYWLEDMPHGEGRMIYANGDIYEGMWSFGKKAGYGKLTRYIEQFLLLNPQQILSFQT